MRSLCAQPDLVKLRDRRNQAAGVGEHQGGLGDVGGG